MAEESKWGKPDVWSTEKYTLKSYNSFPRYFLQDLNEAGLQDLLAQGLTGPPCSLPGFNYHLSHISKNVSSGTFDQVTFKLASSATEAN